tara:strand:+ start:818 stop:1153 length:336 start_codon:yes stop_codon:yes gene_type:complete
MSPTVMVVGVVLKVPGVKLFSGIVGGGGVPTGTTVISGVITLMIVPGVEEGIVETFAGINRTGIERSVGSASVSITEPAPVVVSVTEMPLVGILTPAPITLIGPKQISPVR